MKLGTFAFLLVAILIAFGFVISDDLQLRHRLNETAGQSQDLQRAVEEKDQALQACNAATERGQQLLSQKDALIENLVGALRSRLLSAGVQLEPEAVAAIVLAAQLLVALLRRWKQREGNCSGAMRREYARLSPEELELIVRRRRSKGRR
jgi:flagellar biosynthesis/type III secretory pathway chaperone